MTSEREVRAFSIQFGASLPGASLLSYWYLEQAAEEGIEFWCMVRRGYMQRAGTPMHMVPPPGTNTTRILYLGEPVESIELANRCKADKIGVDLLALGVTDWTLPLGCGMTRILGRVLAPPETARWMRRSRVPVIEVPLPLGPELPADDTRGDALRIVWEGAIPPFAGKLPFLTEQRGLVWRTDGKLLSRGGANELARWADVYVRSEEPILDDPSVAMFLRYGVVSIQRSPLRSLPTRIVEAARARRAGRFVPISGSPRESLAGALSRDLEATGSHEEEREAPVKLGVVVPFGGLSTSQLARTMASAQRGARLGLEWVIAHQRHGGIKSDGAWEDEVREVDDVAFRYKATVRRHSVNGPWNLSAARNAGTCALSDEVTHVLFLDSDLQVRPGFLMSVLDELRSNPMVVVVPFVLNMPSEESRIGSGVATYPVAKLREAGGFDTGYVGWGYEDLDMLSRVRDLGVPSILLHRGADKGSALLIHEDHAPRWEETRGASCERYTSKGKMMSAGGPVDQPTRERSEA